MPTVIAFFASLALHVGVLFSPGWSLPFELEFEPPKLDAFLALANPATEGSKPIATIPRKHRDAKPRKHRAPKATVPVVPDALPPVDSASREMPPNSPELAETNETEPDLLPPMAESEPESNAEAVVQPAPTFTPKWPQHGRITFQVALGEDGMIVGRSEHIWNHDGTNFNIKAVTETTGLAALFRPAMVTQESNGIFMSEGLQPIEFKADKNGKLKDRVLFDPTAGRIELGNGGSALLAGLTQDMLSLFYQLGAMSFDNNQAEIRVATARRLATFTVIAKDVETLETMAGLHLVRYFKVEGASAEDSTEIWLDEQTRLPLRIRYRDQKGKVFTQLMTHIELDQSQ